MKAIMAGGEKALVEIVNATHSGMTVESFTAEVHDWIAKAKHPTSGHLYTAMVFQPMIELLDYLRANDFEVYIVSGGGVRSEEHTSELQSLMRISYAVFCLKKKQ